MTLSKREVFKKADALKKKLLQKCSCYVEVVTPEKCEEVVSLKIKFLRKQSFSKNVFSPKIKLS